VREAAVQGSFYPGEKKALKALLDSFFSGEKVKAESDLVIAPHAGFVYSGRTAAKAFSRLKAHKTFVILAPNHTGAGKEISVYPSGAWRNCLGGVEVDGKMARALVERLPEAEEDELAHLQEHSAEVMLPFLQHRFKSFKILPIVLGFHDLKLAERLAQALFDLSREFDFGLIASSDFTHFQPLESAEEKDRSAIKLIEKLEVEAFHRLVLEKRLSICGFVPIEVALYLARLQGCKRAELLAYSSSAEASGDESNVVGYAALALVKT
jgi:AmmeMemoRadiSam system protein B